MKSFLVVLLSLLLLQSSVAEARSLMERLDHAIWGHHKDQNSAYEAYDQGKFEEASKSFQAFASSHQDDQVSSYNAGVATYKAGHAEDAMKLLERAASGPDPLLKAKALHNAAVIHIDKKEWEPARDSLKEALSFDNDNKAIRENLEWVEEQLKRNPPKPKDQEQKNSDKQADNKDKQDDKKDQQNKDQQSQADNKSDSTKDQKDRQQDSQSGDRKGDKESKGQDQKTAEQKAKDEQAKKEQEAQSGGQSKEDREKQEQEAQEQAASGEERKKQDKEDNTQDKAVAEEQKNKDPKQSKDKGREAMGAEQKAAETKGQAIMTPAELKNQEAERLLRTIDDKIGRYPLTDTEATGKRGTDAKNW